MEELQEALSNLQKELVRIREVQSQSQQGQPVIWDPIEQVQAAARRNEEIQQLFNEYVRQTEQIRQSPQEQFPVNVNRLLEQCRQVREQLLQELSSSRLGMESFSF